MNTHQVLQWQWKILEFDNLVGLRRNHSMISSPLNITGIVPRSMANLLTNPFANSVNRRETSEENKRVRYANKIEGAIGACKQAGVRIK